mgnify:CR=1 FL=1
MAVSATEFDMSEGFSCSYDYVTIAGAKYCGTSGPSNVVMAAGDGTCEGGEDAAGGSPPRKKQKNPSGGGLAESEIDAKQICD